MRVLGVIPARLGSTRLPNKPLQQLAGEPLITRVVQRVLEHGLTDELVVATDSARVMAVAERAGVQAVLTGSHRTGTDRVAEVAGRLEYAAFDVIVNIQGDEPFALEPAVPGSYLVRGWGPDGDAAEHVFEPASVEVREGERATVALTTVRTETLTVLVRKDPSSDAHRFSAASPEIETIVRRLSELQLSHPYQIIDAIYSGPSRAVRALADAFKLGGKK
jgi:hypothetical protein